MPEDKNKKLLSSLHGAVKKVRNGEVEKLDPAAFSQNPQRETEPFLMAQLAWLQQAAQTVSGKAALAVALAVAYRWRRRPKDQRGRQRNTISLGNRDLRDWGVNRHRKMAALEQLQRAGLVTLRLRSKQSPLISMLPATTKVAENVDMPPSQVRCNVIAQFVGVTGRVTHLRDGEKKISVPTELVSPITDTVFGMPYWLAKAKGFSCVSVAEMEDPLLDANPEIGNAPADVVLDAAEMCSQAATTSAASPAVDAAPEPPDTPPSKRKRVRKTSGHKSNTKPTPTEARARALPVVESSPTAPTQHVNGANGANGHAVPQPAALLDKSKTIEPGGCVYCGRVRHADDASTPKSLEHCDTVGWIDNEPHLDLRSVPAHLACSNRWRAAVRAQIRRGPSRAKLVH